MDGLYRAHDGVKNLDRVVVFHLAPDLGEVLVEGDPVEKLHDDVRGVVRGEKAVNIHDIGMLAEFRHVARFVQKAVVELFILILAVLSLRKNDHVARSRLARNKPRGIKLLDGHGHAQVCVPRLVYDAEAAEADHPPDDIPLFEHRPEGEVIDLPLVMLEDKAAFRTDVKVPHLMKTVGAYSFACHSFFSR